MIVHEYSGLLLGRLRQRYKRFFAEIELDRGEIITAHCPNTGPMTGVCGVGSRVAVSPATNPQRKLAYTWEMIEVDQVWVGINTAMPNRIIGHMLRHQMLNSLPSYQLVQPEVKYGAEGSRIDFLLAGSSHNTYLEIKNTTWAEADLALFPDTVTTRGQKHLRELSQICAATSQAVILYFINRADCSVFAPGDRADPVYGQLLRQAIAAGVQVLACRFAVSPEAVKYLGLAELLLP
ncbi:MAG: DNA/RNA nuclease SfsA [Pseudanabaenaceae cyanobacterium bins.68]|nr:DNA/RNA nuclease SfsA [Pseudanabaenaceae cyanobacterium bins.68]